MMKKEIEYRGKKFYPSKAGYWICTKPTYLHREVWISHYGVPPKGFHIHHKDHDKSNNNIENLELMSVSDHIKHHKENPDMEHTDWSRWNIKKAQNFAVIWHKSAKGREWHKQHFLEMKDKFHAKTKRKCCLCGKEVLVRIGKRAVYCSGACKSKLRRDKRIDHILKMCQLCGGEFSSNKYAKIIYCSRSCAGKGRMRDKKIKEIE